MKYVGFSLFCAVNLSISCIKFSDMYEYEVLCLLSFYRLFFTHPNIKDLFRLRIVIKSIFKIMIKFESYLHISDDKNLKW